MIKLLNLFRLQRKQLEYFNIVSQKPRFDWTTSNEVIFKKGLMKLRRFKPFNYGKPVLILPPQAGHHSAICDYSKEQSLVKLLQEYGFDVYSTEWVSATWKYMDLDIESYINYTDLAVNKILEETRYNKISLIGQCQGGWQSSIYTSLYQDKIENLVVAAAPIDYEATKGYINDYTDSLPMLFFNNLVNMNFGLMSGDLILQGFKSADLIEHYMLKYVRLWNMILDDKKDEIERWNHFYHWYEYTQYLPGKFYLEIIDKIFKKNGMVNPGTITINDYPIDLKNITCSLILLAGQKDHITPPEQCFEMEKHVSSSHENITKMLTSGGHIGTLTGKKALKNYWTQVAQIISA